MTKRIIGGVAVLMALATALFGHDLFLKLESYFVPARAAVRVAVLNGSFTTSEGAVRAERLRDLSLVGPHERRALPREAWRPIGDTTWLTVRTAGAGTYVIGASLLPRELGLSAQEFNEYLEHDGIPDVLAARARDGELSKAVRERYHKHVKAILQVGDARTDAFSTVFNYPAEVVPLTNPYAARAGDTLAFRALVDGRAVARQLVIAGGERGGRPLAEVRARTDTAGVVRFAIGEAGKWYVKFIHMRRLVADSVDYESKWATLTFEIR